MTATDRLRIEPCCDEQALRRYIDEHWRARHILATSDEMFRFTYMTPWVDRRAFPAGISVLTITDGSRMLGFLGAICAPYPRQTAYWLALWHVLPELKGGGIGGKLLQRMQELALTGAGRHAYGRSGWIGTFGAGPEALPVYLKRGYSVRAGRRWIFDPSGFDAQAPLAEPTPRCMGELDPASDWFAHRYERHPTYAYQTAEDPAARGTFFRSEDNAWGRVTHAVRLGNDHRQSVMLEYEKQAGTAAFAGRKHLMDCWSFTCPGAGWAPAPDDVPSVFHPPQARGNVTYAVGLPFIPCQIHKGDCDQDRPNAGVENPAHAHA